METNHEILKTILTKMGPKAILYADSVLLARSFFLADMFCISRRIIQVSPGYNPSILVIYQTLVIPELLNACVKQTGHRALHHLLHNRNLTTIPGYLCNEGSAVFLFSTYLNKMNLNTGLELLWLKPSSILLNAAGPWRVPQWPSRRSTFF